MTAVYNPENILALLQVFTDMRFSKLTHARSMRWGEWWRGFSMFDHKRPVGQLSETGQRSLFSADVTTTPSSPTPSSSSKTIPSLDVLK